MHLIENIYQLAGDSYGTVCNIYAIKGNDGITIIEGGDSESLEIAKETMKYWGLSDLPITHVFMTHSHFDHVENAHAYRAMGAKIIALSGDAEAIENGDERVIDYAPFYKMDRFKPCPVDIKPKDGDIVNAAGIAIEVIHLPGHTEGSCYFKYVTKDGKIALFTGDIQRVGYKGDFRSARLAWSGGSDYDRETFFESLKRMKELDADILLPSHGEKTMRNGWKILKNMYLRALLDWRSHPPLDDFKYD